MFTWLLVFPPNLSISELTGILKGKTAIKIFKSYPQLRVKLYWGKDYCVDTLGLDEEKIKKYVKYQEDQERIEEQQRLNFGPLSGPSYKSTLKEGGFFNCISSVDYSQIFNS
jgi:putative transposase